jgi:hypothetical protein
MNQAGQQADFPVLVRSIQWIFEYVPELLSGRTITLDFLSLLRTQCQLITMIGVGGSTQKELIAVIHPSHAS